MPKVNKRSHTTVYNLKGRVRVYWNHGVLHIHEGDQCDVDYSKLPEYKLVFDSGIDAPAEAWATGIMTPPTNSSEDSDPLLRRLKCTHCPHARTDHASGCQSHATPDGKRCLCGMTYPEAGLAMPPTAKHEPVEKCAVCGHALELHGQAGCCETSADGTVCFCSHAFGLVKKS